MAAICPALLSALSVSESMLATDSWVQSPILQDNLLSQFKLNQEIGDDRDRLRDLYSGSELDRGSQEQENS
ncbi:MAG: hypothetical protein WCF82_12350, partial [Microcoleus sp.]